MSEENEEKAPSATAVSRKLAPGGGGGGAWLGGPKTASSEKFGNVDKKNFHLLGTDLFGEEIKADVSGKIREKFEFPPFTILNAREGQWQDRKRAWLSIGIKSEVGRGENLLSMSDTLLEPDPEKRAAMQAERERIKGLTWNINDPDQMRNKAKAETFDSGGPGTLGSKFKAKSLSTQDWVQQKIEEGELDGGLAGNQTGTSIFDPVLTELCYKWFCPPGGQIVDPFSGGSVRGVVAGLLGFKYHGIDLRPEQIAANEAQRQEICPDAPINWVVGDSNEKLLEAPDADLIFSCPPYGDLEVYSDKPDDLSTMSWPEFVKLYMSIIKKAVDRLKQDRFACFVVGEYRDKQTGLYRGFVPLTCTAFMAAGAALYNEAILVTAVGSLPIRVTKQFETTRKMGKTHQNVLIFCKGDPKRAAAFIQGTAVPAAQAPRPQRQVTSLPVRPIAERPVGPAHPIPKQPPLSDRPIKPPPAAPPPMPKPEPLPPPIGPQPGPTDDEGPTASALIPPPHVISAATIAYADTPEIVRPTQVSVGGSMAEFLGITAPRIDWKPQAPPDLSQYDTVALNFATTGLDWAHGAKPVGATLATPDGKAWFLPFAFQGDGNLGEEQVKACIAGIKDKKIVGGNLRFDMHIARNWGIDLEANGNTFSDVMHTAALLDDHRKRFALDALAADYLPHLPMVPRLDERNHAQYGPDQVAARELYTAKLPLLLREAMWPQLEREELLDVQQLEDETICPVVEMEKNGSKLDLELLEKYSSQCTTTHDALMLEICREVGFMFEHNASGWQRMLEHLHLKPSEDGYSEAVLNGYDHPLVKKAQYASQLSSLNSKTFAAYKKLVGPDGILYYDINQLRGDEGGTVSGRFSIGYVQQVPNAGNHRLVFGDEMYPRRLFIADKAEWPDAEYLESDAAQIEYRLYAHFANNPTVIETYRKDPTVSFHKMTHKMMLTHKKDMIYEHQKNFNFAFLYGAKSIKLATMMGFITEKEGDEIRAAKRWNDPRLAQIQSIEAAYRQIMPEGNELIARAAHLAMSGCVDWCKKDKLHKDYDHRGFIKTLLGRRSRFPNNHKPYIALNRVLQGTASDIMKRKLVELHKERKWTNFLMRLTVHDACGGDAREKTTMERVKEILNAQSFALRVPIIWECGVGPTWADAKGK